MSEAAVRIELRYHTETSWSGGEADHRGFQPLQSSEEAAAAACLQCAALIVHVQSSLLPNKQFENQPFENNQWITTIKPKIEMNEQISLVFWAREQTRSLERSGAPALEPHKKVAVYMHQALRAPRARRRRPAGLGGRPRRRLCLILYIIPHRNTATCDDRSIRMICDFSQ